MKKSTFIAISGICIFASCKKTDNNNIVKNSNRNAIVPYASCTINKTKYEDLFSVGTDKSEMEIDQSHYNLIKSFLGLTNNPSFIKTIAQAQYSENNCIQLEVISNLLKESQIGNGINQDCQFEHNGLFYKTVLYVANAEHADFSLSPIMSPGIELYDDVTEDFENHDVIFGWFVNEKNDTIEINIGDYDQARTKRPIVVASLELCQGQEEKIMDLDKSISDVTRRSSFNPKISHAQVNFRYDKTNYSEVWISGIETNKKQVTNALHYKLLDVHKNKIGTYLTTRYNSMGYFQVIDPADVRICYNFYEYDWYASPKRLGYCYLKGTSSGNKYNLDPGNRKFDDEWYAFFPGDLSTDELPTGSITNRGIDINVKKGAIRFYKN